MIGHNSVRTAKARVVASPGKIKINKTTHLDSSQVMANDTSEHGEKLIIQGADVTGMYNKEDDVYFIM